MGVPLNHNCLIGFSTINHPFWGSPIYGNIHICHTELKPQSRRGLIIEEVMNRQKQRPGHWTFGTRHWYWQSLHFQVSNKSIYKLWIPITIIIPSISLLCITPSCWNHWRLTLGPRKPPKHLQVAGHVLDAHTCDGLGKLWWAHIGGASKYLKRWIKYGASTFDPQTYNMIIICLYFLGAIWRV